MSKYKVGDKFIVEICEKYTNDADDFVIEEEILYRVKGFKSLVFDKNGLDKLQKYDDSEYAEGVKAGLDSFDCEVKKAYEKGLQDAWELARKIALYEENGGYSSEYIINAFGIQSHQKVLMTFNPQEALAKIEAYEESKVIKAGDEIAVVGHAIKGYVIDKSKECEDCYVVLITNYKDLHTMIYNKTVIKKTGRHIDIQHLLEQIRG